MCRLTRIVWRDEIASRTVAIEVGMQDSGLGVVLARQNFADPLTAVPSAISSLFHSLIASILAAIWRNSSSHRRNLRSPS
jgi:BASS family bile acid:Na+ symporter